MLANELSVEVLHTFLDTAIPKEKDWHDNQYWMSELPKNAMGTLKFAQQFQRDAIEKKLPERWDMSILAFAIQNHPNLVEGKQEFEDAVKNMKDKRNVLSHKFPATYEKEEFDQLFIDLDGSYKSLLGEPEAQHFSEALKKIQKSKFGSREAKLALCRTYNTIYKYNFITIAFVSCVNHNFVERICDKEIGEILEKRDKELGNRKAKKMDEEIMHAHTILLQNCTDCVQDLATDLEWIIGILRTTAPKVSACEKLMLCLYNNNNYMCVLQYNMAHNDRK